MRFGAGAAANAGDERAAAVTASAVRRDIIFVYPGFVLLPTPQMRRRRHITKTRRHQEENSDRPLAGLPFTWCLGVLVVFRRFHVRTVGPLSGRPPDHSAARGMGWLASRGARVLNRAKPMRAVSGETP